MKSKQAIVIGAGIGGLASAVRLRNKGYQVRVFDKNAQPGGKLTQFKLGQYRFDFGPSLFTMPQYVEDLFKDSGKDPKQYFDYISLDEACRYFYPDGTRFQAPTDKDEFAIQASQVFNEKLDSIQNYFKYNQNIFNNAGRIFLNESMHRLKTFFSGDALKSVAQSYIIELFRSMNKANEKAFQNPKLVQLFNRYATYNGSNPFQAPAMLNSISVLEHLYGTYFPKGGMYSITKALYTLGQELGVEYFFNEVVEEIIVKNRHIAGVRTNRSTYESELVFSNMDVNFTYSKLLPEEKSAKIYLNRSKSSSAVIFYWGIKKNFTELGLHNIFFTRDYKEEFDHIFNKQEFTTDPTVYINITSKYSPGDAPENCSNWFVMVNAPADDGEEETKRISNLRKHVIRKLSSELSENIENLIEEERIVTPRIIESETLSHKGALYGSNSNTFLNAFFRHPNFSGKIKGLYFVGGSVHPGGGIPLCLLSAKIASSLVHDE